MKKGLRPAEVRLIPPQLSSSMSRPDEEGITTYPAFLVAENIVR